MSLREAAAQALAYIEDVDYGPYDSAPIIAALKSALEAEPIADCGEMGHAEGRCGNLSCKNIEVMMRSRRENMKQVLAENVRLYERIAELTAALKTALEAESIFKCPSCNHEQDSGYFRCGNCTHEYIMSSGVQFDQLESLETKTKHLELDRDAYKLKYETSQALVAVGVQKQAEMLAKIEMLEKLVIFNEKTTADLLRDMTGVLLVALDALESCEDSDCSTGHVIYPSFNRKLIDRAIGEIKALLKGTEDEPA